MATQPGAQSGYLASHSLGKPQMERKWNRLGLGGGRHRGRNHKHTQTGMFPFSIPIQIPIHKFTRPGLGCRRHIEKAGRRADTHRELQGPWGLEREMLGDMLCAGGG